MLLKLEAEIERGGVEEGWREGKRRKYSGLARRVARDERGRERVVDRIVSPRSCCVEKQVAWTVEAASRLRPPTT